MSSVALGNVVNFLNIKCYGYDTPIMRGLGEHQDESVPQFSSRQAEAIRLWLEAVCGLGIFFLTALTTGTLPTQLRTGHGGAPGVLGLKIFDHWFSDFWPKSVQVVSDYSSNSHGGISRGGVRFGDRGRGTGRDLGRGSRTAKRRLLRPNNRGKRYEIGQWNRDAAGGEENGVVPRSLGKEDNANEVGGE